MNLKLSFALTVLIHCTSLFNIYAQDTRLLDVYNKEVISYGRNYILNDTVIRFRDVRQLLIKYPDSRSAYLIYKRKSDQATFAAIPGLGLTLASFAFKDRDAQFAALTGGIVLGFVSSALRGKGYKHLQNSLWLYNRDVLVDGYGNR